MLLAALFCVQLVPVSARATGEGGLTPPQTSSGTPISTIAAANLSEVTVDGNAVTAGGTVSAGKDDLVTATYAFSPLAEGAPTTDDDISYINPADETTKYLVAIPKNLILPNDGMDVFEKNNSAQKVGHIAQDGDGSIYLTFEKIYTAAQDAIDLAQRLFLTEVHFSLTYSFGDFAGDSVQPGEPHEIQLEKDYTLHVVFDDEVVSDSELTKSVQVDPVNAHKLNWTIHYTPAKNTAQTGVYIEDVLSDNQDLNPATPADAVKIIQDDVQLYPSETAGAPTVTYEAAERKLKFANLDSLTKSVTITYSTTMQDSVFVQDSSIDHNVSNNAKLYANSEIAPVKTTQATHTVTPTAWVSKKGVQGTLSDGPNGDRYINWTVKIDTNGVKNFKSLQLTDTYANGLTLDGDISIQYTDQTGEQTKTATMSPVPAPDNSMTFTLDLPAALGLTSDANGFALPATQFTVTYRTKIADDWFENHGTEITGEN